MLATGRGDRNGANGRDKRGRNASRGGGSAGAGTRFEVLSRAGEGTLWIVYRVRERASGRIFALKALKGAFNRHPRFPIALISVCDEWRGLEHPHLATLHEVGREDSTLFFTSEWLPGGSLETRLSRPLSREEVLEILRSAASVLAFLHERTLAHGDLRPRQFLFDAAGHIQLTDGGIAQTFAVSALALADVQPDAAWYLAPERTQGAALAPAADVYALGVLLYRMLAGRVPFDGPSPVAIALRHRSDAPLPPSQFNARCPADLEQLALRLLEKDPARRPTAAALLQRLENEDLYTDDLPVTVGSAPVSAPAPVPLSDELKAATTSSTGAPVSASQDTIAVKTVDNSAPSPVPAPLPRRVAASPVINASAPKSEEEPQIELVMRRRRHRWREFWGAFGALIWLFVVAGALVGMCLGAYNYWITESPKTVLVPNYLGLEQERAKQVLAKAGLSLRIGRETYDARKPEGTVVSGQPEPGRLVRAKREVTVTISQGESPISMYDFSDLPLNQARQIIAKNAMRLGSIQEQFHDRVPRGYICGQYPDPNEPFRRSEPITLIVSRGPQPSEIDATTGALPPDNSPLPDEPLPDASVPLESSPANQGDQNISSRTARVSVQMPSDGAAHQMRIIVRDASGERVVYSGTHRAGQTVIKRVRVQKSAARPALVRVYVDQTLVKEDQL